MFRIASTMVRFITRMTMRTFRQPTSYILKSACWDAFLILIPGVMGLATGFRMRTDKYSSSYLEVICHSSSTWPLYAPSILLVTSIVAIFIGIFRFAVIGLTSKQNTCYYIFLVLILANTNLISGISTIAAGKKIRLNLEASLLDEIHAINVEGSPYQISSDLEESWDVLQIQFTCCGINGYYDYTELPGAKHKTAILPQSCCSITWKKEMPKMNNYEQCQLDARLSVKDSLYINTMGCLDHLYLWLKHYLYAQMFVMFCGATAQYMAIVYAFIIYYRPLVSTESKR